MARQPKIKAEPAPANAPQVIKQTEQAAIQRGFVPCVTEAEHSWNLAIWYNGHQHALIQLSKGALGTCISRFYDKTGTCIRVTTDSPALALRQCAAL